MTDQNDLAAVSRPAEARGEPTAWGVVDSKGTMCWAEAEKTRKLKAHLAWCDEKFPEDAPHTLVPLYTHPAPSGGEGDATKPGPGVMDVLAFHRKFTEMLAAPRPEPGEPSEAMVEAAARAQYEQEHSDVPWERCASSFADGYREDARLVLRAALAAQREQTP